MEDRELKKKTAGGLFWGGLGAGAQQLLSVILGIFLARLLAPSDYGMVGMLAIFTSLATTLEDCGLKIHLVNKESIEKRDYDSVFTFSLAVGVLFYLIFFFCAPLIARFYHTTELVALSRFVFLNIIVTSFSVPQSAYMAKTFMVKQQTVASIIASVLSGIVGVVMALCGKGYWCLAVQTFLYTVVRTFCLWAFSPLRPELCFNFKPLAEMVRKSYRLPLTSVFTLLSGNFFSVLFGRYYTSREVGYYSQANKWSLMGYNLINSMVSSVSQPLFSTVDREAERQLRIFGKMVRFTSFFSFPFMLGLALVAPEFITLTITDKWLPSVGMLRLLCILEAFAPLSSLLSTMVLTKGRYSAYMGSTITLSSLVLVMLFLMRRFSIMTMVASYAGLNIIWIVVWFFLVHRFIGYRFVSLVKDVGPFIAISAIVLCVTYFLTRGISSLWLLLLSRIAIATVLYCITMKLLRCKTFEEVLSFAENKLRGGSL